LPVQTGLVLVFDAATGCPVAILVDNGYLSRLRAGAAGALAARYLANEYLERVAVIGSGNQAYIQLKSLMAIRQVGSVSVWDRSPEQADSYARLLVEDHDLDMEIAPSIEAAASQADLIITATASRKPLLRAEWLKPGVHITAVGSDEPGKQELYPEVLQHADIIVVDSYEQCAVAGELCHALAAGLITRADVRGELADLVTGQTAGRTRSDEITVADLTGLDLHDAAIASLAVEKALFLGLGQRASGTLC
jgi:ornithine cyclodeaminase